MGAIYFRAKSFKNALECFLKVLNIRNKYYEEDCVAIVEVITALGYVYE